MRFMKKDLYLAGVLLVFIGMALLSGCAQFGYAKPKTAGQGLVWAYGSATAGASLIPTVLMPPSLVTSSRAQNVLDATRVVHNTIDAYWDAAGLLECKHADPGLPGVVEKCEGPNAQQVMDAIKVSLFNVTNFVATYQGVKR